MRTGRLAALMRHFLPGSHEGDSVPRSGNLTLNLFRSRQHIWNVSSAVSPSHDRPPSPPPVFLHSLAFHHSFFPSSFLHNRYIVSALE